MVTKQHPFFSSIEYIHLKDPMQNVTSTTTSKVVFLCDIIGEPIPSFTWLRGDKRIQRDPAKYRIKTELWGSM